MGSAPANPNPPMAVTSTAPLLPVAAEHHFSSLSLSSTSAPPLFPSHGEVNRQGPTMEMRQRSLRRRDRSRLPLSFLLPHARSHPPSMAISSRLGQPQRSVTHSRCRVYLEEWMDHITKLLKCIKYGMVATLADCSVHIISRRFCITVVYLPHCLPCFGHLHFILNHKMELKKRDK